MVENAVVGDNHHRTSSAANRRVVRLVLFLYEIDGPEEHCFQVLRDQISPSFKNIADLVEQRVRIELCRPGEKGENVRIAVCHGRGCPGIPAKQGRNRLGSLGEGEAFGSKKGFCGSDEGGILLHDLMQEVAAKRLFIKVIQRKRLLHQKGRGKLLYVEGKNLLGGMVLVDKGGKAGEEIWFAVAEVSTENTLIELMKYCCGMEFSCRNPVIATLCLHLAVVDVCEFRCLLVERKKIGIRRKQRWKKIHFSPGAN